MKKILLAVLVCAFPLLPARAQRYEGVIDKSVALIGNDIIMLSDIESEAQMMRAQGLAVDRVIKTGLLQTLGRRLRRLRIGSGVPGSQGLIRHFHRVLFARVLDNSGYVRYYVHMIHKGESQ